MTIKHLPTIGLTKRPRLRKIASRQSNRSYQKLEPRQLLASISFEDGQVYVLGDATNDVIELVGSADFQSFTVRVNGNPNLTETFLYRDVTNLAVNAGGGNDVVTSTIHRDSLIYGGDGNDRLEGGFRNDLIFGGNGIDTLIGRSGDDTLRGQSGLDWIYGGPGEDLLNGHDTSF